MFDSDFWNLDDREFKRIFKGNQTQQYVERFEILS